MDRIPIYDATEPVVCTIGDEEVAERVRLLESMRTRLTAVERTEHGLLLRFPATPEVEADVRRFAADEQRCCRFWGFAVRNGPDVLTLRWDAPPAAGALLARIERALTGDDPVTSIAGLL